jgi:hypothetical protein
MLFVMTYFEFSNQLVSELRLTKENTLLMYNSLKGTKGYLDDHEHDIYLKVVGEFLSLADQTERLMNLFLNGVIYPFDEMD